MSDPLSLVPFALAAAGGTIDGFPTHQLVAGGVTLLQRSAPLVRALGADRSGILLPAGPAWLVALAASDGRGAVLLDRSASADDIARTLVAGQVGAVFTVSTLRSLLPPGTPMVCLDESPQRARVLVGDRDQTVDLGSHHGLSLEGAREAEGRDEACLLSVDSSRELHAWSHRDLLTDIRHAFAARGLTPLSESFAQGDWSRVDQWIAECAAPLYAGGTVRTH